MNTIALQGTVRRVLVKECIIEKIYGNRFSKFGGIF